MSSATQLTIVLRARPTGPVEPACFGQEQRPIEEPRDGQLRVRPLFISVDPYMRGRMSTAKSYIAPFELDEPIESGAMAEVVLSRHPSFQPGDIVNGLVPWQAQPVVEASAMRKAMRDAPVSAQLGVLGMPGLTAYVGLLDFGKPKAGETVFVSGAAGAVGSIAGQIAKLHGCHVVGSAGSDAKVRYVRDELGFDAAFNYKTCGDLRATLAQHCPRGIDVYFDNVGGDTLEAVLWNLNDHARIALCGMIAVYEENERALPPGPRNLMELVRKRARMEGFIVTDHGHRMKQFAPDMLGWLREGKVKYHETFVDGLARAPEAFMGMLHGENLGKMLVRMSG